MLKSLDLFGFKSFADKTTFDFAPGITCVVGPNGSGKSNVVDAIKWILGDQSPKSLRGKEMTDVIFNGSSSRKPAGLAEATLTFDNRKGLLAVDSAEVQVSRRIYRSGEAEYLINRAPARLKDVRELFLGTGAGTSAYSIIEQGRVDSLLQATNLNRRIVFEEAAGVSRYKLRKVDALRKLERVGQNLLRLTDIVDEVSGQLNTLRSQAAKATRFREYTEELKSLRIGISADDYRALQAQLAEVEQQNQTVAADLRRLAERHQAIEAEQAGVDARIGEMEDRLREVERAAAETREAIAGHEATIAHQAARKTELDTELVRLEQQQTELAARAQDAVGELQQTEGSLQQYVADFASRNAALESRDVEIRRLAANLEETRRAQEQVREQQLAALQQKSMLEHRVASFELQFAALEANRQRASKRAAQLDQELAAARAEFDRRKLLVESALERISDLRGRTQAQRAQRDELVAELEERQRTLAQQREQRSAGQARRVLLEDLEHRQEGLGIGVKEILSRAQAASTPPWNTVLGSVADLLVVELEQAALLEVALGNRAQVIVLSQYEPLIDYLNQGKCQISGRVGFLAIARPALADEAPPRMTGGSETRWLAAELGLAAAEAALPDLSGCAGVVSRADRLVKSAAGIHRLAEQLLADTWIVHSLDVALQLARGAGRGGRFVTLQGELLDADGTLYVGMVHSETALVSRKSELRSLKNDLLRLDKQVAAGELELGRLGQMLAELDQRLQVALGEIEQHSDDLANLKSELGSQEMGLERLRRDRAEAQVELGQFQTSRQQLEAEAIQAREASAQIEEQRQALQHQLEQAERELAELDRALQELQAQQRAEQVDLAKHEERLHNLQNARTRLDQERYERDLQREEALRRLQLVASKRDQLESHLLNSQGVVAELAAKRDAFAEQVAIRHAEREQVRQHRGTLAEQELRLRHERREVQERQHARELTAREIRQQVEHLTERLRDEYQVELSEVAAAGASALQACASMSSSLDDSGEPVRADTSGAEVDPAPVRELAAARVTSASPGAEGDALVSARAEVEAKIDRLRRKLKVMGNVNTDSLRDLDELESRHERLSTQLQDLVEAKTALEEIVRRINQESKRMFTETFTEIRRHFQELFRKLFGGGEGDVVLEDPEDVLECGIDVVARPPGKELRSISLLSGGEKTLTAVALLLAIFKSRPSPFCILDEVDAALDEGNVERYMRVIQEFQTWTQFIVITHSKRTMTAGAVLYGVTMEESGVSKRMSVRFEDVSEDGHFRAHPTSDAA
jgi:chromosome segregation protein